MFTTLVDLISGGAFEQEGSGGRGGGASISIYERDESDGCSKKTPLYITRLVMTFFLEGLMFHAVCNPVFMCSNQRVKSLNICCCTWIERWNISIDRYNHVDTIIF